MMHTQNVSQGIRIRAKHTLKVAENKEITLRFSFSKQKTFNMT